MTVSSALASLYDSLNAMLFRMPADAPESLWVARIMFRIGELTAQGLEGNSGQIDRARHLAERVSTADANDSEAAEALLGEIDSFLDGL